MSGSVVPDSEPDNGRTTATTPGNEWKVVGGGSGGGYAGDEDYDIDQCRQSGSAKERLGGSDGLSVDVGATASTASSPPMTPKVKPEGVEPKGLAKPRRTPQIFLDRCKEDVSRYGRFNEVRDRVGRHEEGYRVGVLKDEDYEKVV